MPSWLDGMWDNTPFGGNAGASAPDPYEAYDEYRRRRQLESDREYELRAQELQRRKEEIAITRGRAEAERWYQRESMKLAKEKFEQDKFQFEVTATGYYNGRPTLDRERFQDSSLQGWTDKALTLASTPKDWVKLARMYAGVSNNIGSMPGLNWASGGQVGNTAFAGNPETNSLANVLGNMGVNAGGGSGGNWASSAAQQADNIANSNPAFNPGQQQIYQTAREFGMNPAGAAPGWFESLDPTTKSLLEGAAQAQGLDWATSMSKYRRSRFGSGGDSRAA